MVCCEQGRLAVLQIKLIPQTGYLPFPDCWNALKGRSSPERYAIQQACPLSAEQDVL